MNDVSITPDLDGIVSETRDPLDFDPTLSIPTVVTDNQTVGDTMLFTDTPGTSVA